MTEVKRSYDASGRRAQARARRLAVVLAARDLFERDGYRTTTIAAIAAHAGVSAESVYKGFGTKAALAKAVFDLALAGDDEPVPVAERPSMQAVRDEPAVRRKIAMFAAGIPVRTAAAERTPSVSARGTPIRSHTTRAVFLVPCCSTSAFAFSGSLMPVLSRSVK